MDGFIKLHRQFLEWEWYDNKNVKIVFLHCLFRANFREQKWHGKIIKAGQFVTSIQHLSEEVCLSVKQTRNALEKLKLTGEIDKQGASHYSIITINNWDKWQVQGKQKANEGQTEGKQWATIEERKESKERKNNNILDTQKIKKFIPPSLNEVQDYCLERNNGIDAERFINFYESKGWFVGKNKMKDWKAAVRTWESKNKIQNKPLRSYEENEDDDLYYRICDNHEDFGY